MLRNRIWPFLRGTLAKIANVPYLVVNRNNARAAGTVVSHERRLLFANYETTYQLYRLYQHRRSSVIWKYLRGTAFARKQRSCYRVVPERCRACSPATVVRTVERIERSIIAIIMVANERFKNALRNYGDAVFKPSVTSVRVDSATAIDLFYEFRSTALVKYYHRVHYCVTNILRMNFKNQKWKLY